MVEGKVIVTTIKQGMFIFNIVRMKRQKKVKKGQLRKANSMR